MKSFPTTKKPDKPSKNTKFSDVIAIEAIEGHLRHFLLKIDLKYVSKKVTNRKPLNCRIKS
jgi:hypothetical protein